LILLDGVNENRLTERVADHFEKKKEKCTDIVESLNEISLGTRGSRESMTSAKI
jgi:hypothetical protein